MSALLCRGEKNSLGRFDHLPEFCDIFTSVSFTMLEVCISTVSIQMLEIHLHLLFLDGNGTVSLLCVCLFASSNNCISVKFLSLNMRETDRDRWKVEKKENEEQTAVMWV